MHYEEISIQVEGSSPDTKLYLYLQEKSESIDIEKRPLILICPGGGYAYTSDREAEPIAFTLLSFGVHVAVLRYSCAPAKYPTALLECCEAMKKIREIADQYAIDADKIGIMGFSAGGHLAASLATLWRKEKRIQEFFGGVSPEVFRPNALILCSPVITAGEFAHRGSFENLIGYEEKEQERNPNQQVTELLDLLSLEKQVSEDVPKTFLWHTFEDQAVPLENSLMFANALRKQNIPFEYHVFPVGHHGLALANRLTDSQKGRDLEPVCEAWVPLLRAWLEKI